MKSEVKFQDDQFERSYQWLCWILNEFITKKLAAFEAYLKVLHVHD